MIWSCQHQDWPTDRKLINDSDLHQEIKNPKTNCHEAWWGLTNIHQTALILMWFWPPIVVNTCKLKRPTRCNRLASLLQNSLFVQHVSGTIMTIIRSSRVIQMVAAICITPELLMMGIMVSKTCWTNSKFCNKETNLLHLVGLLISTY